MVSETTSQPVVSSTIPGNKRGFIPEETVVAAGPGNASVTLYRPFWRPVVAGAIFALSVFVLSWYLMLGCHVGIDSDGMIVLDAGAAVWLWVTAIIAFYFGGLIASAMTSSPATMGISSSGTLKGAVLWALSIPLALIIYGYAAANGHAIADLSLPHASAVVANPASAGLHMGFYWSAFIALGLALIFAIVGGVSGCACRKQNE
jgi:hypothetical protein